MKLKLNRFLVLVFALGSQLILAQEKTISGVVSDGNNPMPGTNIVVKGTSKTASSGFDGRYSIKANTGDVLIFSFMGMKNIARTVGSSNEISVVMQNEEKALDEIVVIGYGTQKRKEITSSISKIKGSDIQGLVTPSFESQLAGRASGVQVTTQSGILGAPPKVRIRGVASISQGTDPLYVVDGVPMYSGDVGGYASASGLGDLNPNDIETYEILKDGAASAIYGSRAANGVILITTKKGKKGSMSVNFNSVLGVASPVNTFDLLTGGDFITIANEKRTNRSQAPWAVANDIETDWQGAVLRKNAVQIDHSLSLNGGNDKTKYYMSLGYSKQEGIALANDMLRYSFKTNLEHQLNNWLTIGGGTTLTKTDYNGLNVGRNSLSGNMFNAIRQLPNVAIYDSTTPTGYNITPTNTMGLGSNTTVTGDNISNIAYVLDKNILKSSIQRMLFNAFLSANIVKGLNYRFQASVDNPITKGFRYNNPIHGDGFTPNGRLDNDNTNFLRYNIQHILNYKKSFADSHNIGATAVYEIQKERNENFFATGTNLLNEFYNQHIVTGAYGTQESGGSVTERGIISYIGRATYNYKERYFLQGSIRRDAISQVAQRNALFTGYSASWNVANESFMKGISNIINDFRIRASYAKTGNIEIGSYPYLNLASGSQYAALNGVALTQLGNKDLSWETSSKKDYGVDLGFLNNRVRITADIFENNSDGLILASQIAPSLGVPENRIFKNVGVVKNKGYEFSADINILRDTKLKWDVSGNLTLQNNNVVSLPNNNADFFNASTQDVSIAPNIIVRVGESANSLFGFEYAGVNAANGNPMYYKADGSIVQANYVTGAYNAYDPANPTNVSVLSSLTLNDRQILGNTLPTYFGGLTSKMSYKNIDFSFLFRFSGGNRIFNSTRRELMNQNFNNNSTEILGRWQSVANPGDGVTPRLFASSNQIVNQSSNASSRFVEKGDFISLDNISLGYNLPKVFLEKIKIENIRFFIQAQNILMITKYKGLNPEMETFGVDLNGTPRAKVLSIGINVNL